MLPRQGLQFSRKPSARFTCLPNGDKSLRCFQSILRHGMPLSHLSERSIRLLVNTRSGGAYGPSRPGIGAEMLGWP